MFLYKLTKGSTQFAKEPGTFALCLLIVPEIHCGQACGTSSFHTLQVADRAWEQPLQRNHTPISCAWGRWEFVSTLREVICTKYRASKDSFLPGEGDGKQSSSLWFSKSQYISTSVTEATLFCTYLGFWSSFSLVHRVPLVLFNWKEGYRPCVMACLGYPSLGIKLERICLMV